MAAMRTTLSALALALALAARRARADPCLGEFEYCPLTGECVLDSSGCGKCTSGQYLCPDFATCVLGAVGYLECPGLRGTHLDWTLPIEQRLDYLVYNLTLAEIVSQLTNDAPAITRLGAANPRTSASSSAPSCLTRSCECPLPSSVRRHSVVQLAER